MCTTDLCNANDYDFHIERANELFGRTSTFRPVTSSASRNAVTRGNFTGRGDRDDNSLVTIVTPSPNKKRGHTNKADQNEVVEEVNSTSLKEVGGQQRTEVLWGKTKKDDDIFEELSNETVEDEEDFRFPRQANGGKKSIH